MAIVHNGIIENFKPLRDELIAEGREFQSQTDTEVVAHLVAREIERGAAPRDAVAAVLPRLHGAFALGVMFANAARPADRRAARRAADGRLWRGRELPRLRRASRSPPLTQRIAYLEEGDWVAITRDEVEIFDRDNKPRRAPDRRFRRVRRS